MQKAVTSLHNCLPDMPGLLWVWRTVAAQADFRDKFSAEALEQDTAVIPIPRGAAAWKHLGCVGISAIGISLGWG